jgi:hypothetical protein
MTTLSKLSLVACAILAVPALADSTCQEKAAPQLRAVSAVMPAKPSQLRVAATSMSGAEVTALRNGLRFAIGNCQVAERSEPKKRPTSIASGLLDDLY